MRHTYEDIERVLPTQLEELASTVACSRLTLSGVDRRVAERARKRRTRRAIASATMAIAVVASAGAIQMNDPGSRTRVISGGDSGGAIAPAGQPAADPGDSAATPSAPSGTGPTPAATSAAAATETTGAPSTVRAPIVEATPDQKPIGAQTPDPVKNAPAAPEPAANSGQTSRGSSIAPGPPNAVEVLPPSGQLDVPRGAVLQTGNATP
ncbi:MAG: hypothetical protein M3256_01470 [Actinomycetota bacterium]|nr:hypothetical protein [Actinomycetota bacterium]